MTEQDTNSEEQKPQRFTSKARGLAFEGTSTSQALQRPVEEITLEIQGHPYGEPDQKGIYRTITI